MAEFPIHPTRTAVINVDMQRCFVEGTPLAPPAGIELAGRINRLTAACREANVLVVHTRCRLEADGSNLGIVPELVPPFIYALYTAGAGTGEMHDAVTVADGDVIVDKPRYGAFTGTDLESMLRSRGIDTVVISGIATNICCETTAREASQLDFRVIFLSDGTATQAMNGVSAEDLQRATCASLGQVFAEIATIDDLLAKIAAGSAAPFAAQVAR